jgi:hypothetical protein
MTAPHLPSVPMTNESAEEVKQDEPWRHWEIPEEITDEEMEWHFRDWAAWADEELPW